jgi:hypothetical protein
VTNIADADINEKFMPVIKAQVRDSIAIKEALLSDAALLEQIAGLAQVCLAALGAWGRRTAPGGT